MTKREQREGIRGRHLLPPTADDLARDLRAEIAEHYAHVPLTAPVACGPSYLAAVRRAVAAEDLRREVGAVVRIMDELSATRGDDGIFRRCRDRLRNLLPVPDQITSGRPSDAGKNSQL